MCCPERAPARRMGSMSFQPMFIHTIERCFSASFLKRHELRFDDIYVRV
jgi:hypothetical protein